MNGSLERHISCRGSRAADSPRVVAKRGTSELSPGETFRKGTQVYKRHQTWELLSMPSGDMLKEAKDHCNLLNISAGWEQRKVEHSMTVTTGSLLQAAEGSWLSLGWKDGESLLPSRALGLFDHPRNKTSWLSNQISSGGGSCMRH